MQRGALRNSNNNRPEKQKILAPTDTDGILIESCQDEMDSNREEQ